MSGSLRQSLRAFSVTGCLLGAAALIAYFAALSPPYVLTILQNRFPPPSLADGAQVAGIIALGGQSQRVLEAVRLARLLPGVKLVITGALPADYAYAESLGFNSRLILERAATTTYENAVFSRQLLKPKPAERWLLVTSAAHVPRAVGSFRRAGFNVVPWSVPDQISSDGVLGRVTVHESLGLVGYWLFGRTDALFPAPETESKSLSAQLQPALRPAPAG
jgi:uncharacterized SAM-binding protein YcdF (DUF218 family)